MRRCEVCNNIMVEGYVIESMGETFCSDTCIESKYPGSVEELKNMTEEELDNSTFYWTAWEDRVENVQAALDEIPEVDSEEEREVLYSFISDNFERYTNESSEAQPKQVWLIHDNIYFDERFAELFEDGKDHVTEQYIILEPGEEVTEGACYHTLFNTQEEALEQIKEDAE